MPLDGMNLKEMELGLILLDAADRIERDGWCQGRFNDGLRVCPVKAIRDAAGGTYSSALLYLQSRLGIPNFTEWNDDPARTKEEVIRALRGE